MLMPLRRWLRALARGKRCKTRSTKPLSANLNITTTRREAPTVRSLLREREKESLPASSSVGAQQPNRAAIPCTRATSAPKRDELAAYGRRGEEERGAFDRSKVQAFYTCACTVRILGCQASWYYLIAVPSTRCLLHICILDGRHTSVQSLRSLP